jgi:hypothetical protein
MPCSSISFAPYFADTLGVVAKERRYTTHCMPEPLLGGQEGGGPSTVVPRTILYLNYTMGKAREA